jgi:uncharacterized protein YggE
MNQETRESLLHGNQPLRWAAVAVLAVLALFLLVKTFDALARYGEGDNPQVNTITVSGTGSSSATPDIAKITFTVQESASTVQAAQDAATKRANDAIAAMDSFSIKKEDIKTLDYNVSPQYASTGAMSAIACMPGVMCPRPATSNKITGYQVTETIEVTVRDTAKAGDVLAKLGSLGVQNISGPNFMVDDDNGVMNEARAEAIANAQAKAKELAKELGVHLGDVVSYYDQGNVIYSAYGKGGGAATDVAAPNLPVGTDERTVTVQVTYRIK